MGDHVTAMGLTSTAEKKELKKHAATIHCSNTLSLLQRKITNALLYHAYKELRTMQEHEITVKQLCRLIGYQGNNHAAIREALKGLISTIIEWNVVDDETGFENWTASSIIASVSLEGPICYYAYSPRMKLLLHSPSMFGKIDLVIQSKFRSSYGLALYENCIRYRGLPYTKWFEMDLFKKLMGVPKGRYDIFRDFKRRVLDKAVDEVNTYSDLVVQSEILREGRKVVRVRFQLKERPKKTRLGAKPRNKKKANTTFKELDHVKIEDINEDILKTKLLVEFGLTEEQTNYLIKEYDLQFVNNKMNLIIASKSYQQGKIQNLAAYLFSALKHNYLPSTQIKPITPMIDLSRHQQIEELKEVKQKVEAIRKEYTQYREQVIAEMISSLSPELQTDFMSNFWAYAEPTINTILKLQRNKYSKNNIFDSPLVKAQLRQFAIRELDSLSIFSLEEFIAQLDEEKREAWQKLKSFDPEHPLTKFQEV